MGPAADELMEDGKATTVARLAVQAMGTWCEIVVRSPRDADAIAERAAEILGEWHTELTRFEPGGTVWRLNSAAGSSVPVNDEIGALLDRCVEYSTDSRGAFSIVRCADRFEPTPGRLVVGSGTGHAGLANRDHSIDLGGVAKGFAFDRIREELIDLGCAGAFVHGGTSTIVALGDAPAGEAWAVRLDAGEGVPAPTVSLRDRSMSVSSQAGDRPGHIIDPRTGEPATDRGFAACIGESAEETDAWATALAVLGERPDSMPQRLTSVIRCPAFDGPSAWAVEGPDRDAVFLPQTQPGDQP